MTHQATSTGIHNLDLAGLISTCENLQSQGESHKALEVYRAWTESSSDPNRHLAYFNYGSLQQSTGDLNGAAQSYQKSLEIHAGFPEALINLGLVLEKLGQLELAIQQWSILVSRNLLKNGPTDQMLTMALNHIGRAYENIKEYELAEKALEQSLNINPKQSGTVQHWVHIRQKSCKWPVYKETENITFNNQLMNTSPLAMLALSDDPVQQLLTAHAFVGRTYGFDEEWINPNKYYSHSKIRIGYVSGDLCVHAVGLLLAEMLEGHDKQKFEIYGYDYSPEDGTPHRSRLKATFDQLRGVHSLTDRQIAELIVQDEIDVLIDLHGLSSGARPGIFALHPAPLQGTYLGFIGTTAMPWFDFVITDPYALPPSLSPFFTEKPLYVKGSFIPLAIDDKDIPTVTREMVGFTNDQFVMAAFGNVYKINADLFDAWIHALEKIDNAVLWLIDDNETTTHQLKSILKQKGIASSKVVFSTRASHSEYKARLKLADLYLDSFPYNCGSTTNDVISMGVPMITISGKTMVSRMGGSILSALNMQDLITSSYEEYQQKIIDIAQNNQSKELSARLQKEIQNKKNQGLLVKSIEDELIELVKKSKAQ